MSVDERMVKAIVQRVMANMQIAGEVSGMRGVFKDMNDAISASIEAQKKVRVMSLDQREKIISVIRKKVHENAELLANMGVNETGMGNVGDKILKHHLTAEKTPGTEDISTIGRQGADSGGNGTLRGNRCNHSRNQPFRDGYLQLYWNVGRRKYGGV